MYKRLRNLTFAAITAILITMPTISALAVQDYSGGPGMVNTETSAASTQVGPGGPEEPAPAPEEQASVPEEQPQETQAAEQAVAPETTALPAGAQAYLQIQLLSIDKMAWTDPIVDDTTVLPGDQGFLSMCIFANNLPGDVLYRTYAAPTGWSSWAMNGAHTSWTAGVPIEAVQIRLTGVFHDHFDIYYSSTLSDGMTCGWSRNGGTNGTMAAGKYITGLRLSMWGKGVEGASYDMNNQVVAAAPDGIQFTGGLPVFSNGTGEPYTGWAWNDQDCYYFVDSNAVTGWQYIDGYKYFFESDGHLVKDLEPYLNSPGPFYLRINKQMNCTTVYVQDGENGFIIPYKTFLCSTGDDTPEGDHKTPEKYRWRLMVTGEYCQYCTRLGAGLPILMHSVIYSGRSPYTLKPSTYNYLGYNRSHGCIRFTTADAKWIFEHCPLGTSVNVYNSPIPSPFFDRPAIKQMIPLTQTWDPTDVEVPENNQ